MQKEHADTVTKSYQPSMTEWFAAIGELEESSQFHHENTTRMDRLEILPQTIGTRTATEILTIGNQIEVDSTAGSIRVVAKS